MQIISTILGPLMSPLATAGIVIVFVIFLLLKREDLRDRLIRLAGSRGLPRTTRALDDAAQRVGRYLLMQLVVNTTYAIPIGIGLWLIGIPNPVLWGLLCGLMRFVPYIGPIVAAFFPLALSIAVDPGWTTLLLTAGLFIAVELIINNLIEPWLYGASTGLSPLAIIAAAVFWTWLWGPIGLLLSTPLTVCLVVLGRHVPQFAFLDVLLGNEPALSPPELLYRRLLAGDPNEATERAEEYLREHTLDAFYDAVAVPALALAEEDRAELHLSDEQRLRVSESALLLIDNLEEWEGNGHAKSEEEPDEPAEDDFSRLKGVPILCVGARGNLDDAAAAALAQLLERRGADVRLVAHESLQTAALRETELGQPAAVVLSYLNSDSLAHARFLVRRFRRRLPEAKIVVGLWTFEEQEAGRRNPLEATRADAVATSLKEAMASVLEAVVIVEARRGAAGPRGAALTGLSGQRSAFRRFQLVDQALDHGKPHLPEAGIARVETEGRQELLVALRAAGLEHREILLLEPALRPLVDRVERVHEAIAEGVGVDVERRVDEVGDIGPEGLVAGAEANGRPEAFVLHVRARSRRSVRR